MSNRILKNSFFALWTLLCLGLSNLSNAQDIYVGLSAGSTEFDGSQFGDRNNAWGLHVGINLGRFFGAEVSYTDYQKFDSRVPSQLQPSPVALSAVGIVKYPILDRLEIFGKAGYARISTDIDSSNPFYAGSIDENNPVYGLGLNFILTDNWSVRAAYDRTEMNLGNIPAGGFFARSNGNLDLVSVGLMWEF